MESRLGRERASVLSRSLDLWIEAPENLLILAPMRALGLKGSLRRKESSMSDAKPDHQALDHEAKARAAGWDGAPPPPLSHSSLCPVFLAVGWLCVGLGFVGAFLPGLPTTVFLIIALWAFSKSSDRLRWWLWTHPKFGATLRAWHMHRVIPPPAKTAAVVMMMISVAIVAVTASTWVAPTILAVVLAPIATWIVTRRSALPLALPDSHATESADA